MKRTTINLLIGLVPLAVAIAQPSRAGLFPLTAENTRELELRNIGPSSTPGRVADVAVDPRNRSVWYVAVASGGLWKTSNRGTTWEPIFDDGGSYSMGCVVVDPNDSSIVWLGTGENHSQRSVGFGDGVYKSTDTGKTWKRMGLANSEHINKILVDPRDSKVVFVATPGPLWNSGGDRGLFKTTDGGETWKAVLEISENTGVGDVVADPRNPDVLYAATLQRQRHTGVLVGGGPEGAIYKSVDGGAHWRKLTNGIPTVDLGPIALAVSPEKPDVIYALITAADREGGFFRSEDAGETWTGQGTFVASVPEYYTELFPDPEKFDWLYTTDARMQLTENGGKTVRAQSWRTHGDHHTLVFDPTDPNHLLDGNDDGLDESYDGGKTWRHFNNMPTTQYYRVAVDYAQPFYNVYGGAQDNGSCGFPSRSINSVGIRIADWFRIGGADGFQPRADYVDSSIVYSMSQSGGITRLDRKTSASKNIRAPRDSEVRWNWDAPFVISPHSHTRLYLAGSKLYRSDTRGDSWTGISPDLTRQMDRSTIPLMGRLWPSNAVDRDRSTTPFGVASALSESPLKEGLLYVGTDDGLIQVSQDGGTNWQKIEKFPGVPELAYVSDVCASAIETNTVYASFNNFLYGDFKPYLFKSTDCGKTWKSIAGDLPDRQFVWSVVEDFVDKNLLFAGTEFGLFFTVDGGQHWVKVNGAPPIPFRDLEIQRRENDLVAATFGRGFYILDDYSALRGLTPETLSTEATMLPVRRTYVFDELTGYEVHPQDFTAPNPPFGAMLTYYVRDDLTNDDAQIVLTISDADGKEIRRLDGVKTAGLHRATWNLRANGSGARRGQAAGQPAENSQVAQRGAGGGDNSDEENPQRNNQAAGRRGGRGGRGQRGGGNAPALVKPGKYTAALNKLADGKLTPLGAPQTFEVVPLPGAGGTEVTKPHP